MKTKAKKDAAIVVGITDSERAALAFWLVRIQWSAPEEVLANYSDIFQDMGLEEYRKYLGVQTNAASLDMPTRLLGQTSRNFALTPGALLTILQLFPSAQTPPELGMQKVCLLRKLRAKAPAPPKPPEENEKSPSAK